MLRAPHLARGVDDRLDVLALRERHLGAVDPLDDPRLQHVAQLAQDHTCDKTQLIQSCFAVWNKADKATMSVVAEP